MSDGSSTLTLGYPSVLDEAATIARCLEGYSLARYGDGELKLMFVQGYSREPANGVLASELRMVFKHPHERCIVGMPTMDPAGPKYSFIEPRTGLPSGWVRHKARFITSLEGTSVTQYYSAFVTRPDSAPWIRTKEFAESMESLWRGKVTTIICEKNNSLYRAVRLRAGKLTHIRCPHSQAYSQIDRLEAIALATDPEVVIISAGPTATCLANRLARHGVQAIDLGSCGRWIGQLLGVK